MNTKKFTQLFFLLFFINTALSAQSMLGAIVGKLKNDMSGDPIANAKVNIQIEGAHVKYGLSDYRGQYRIYNIDEGEYDILVKAIGFSTMIITEVPIRSLENTELELDFYSEGYSLDTIKISYYDLYPDQIKKKRPKKRKRRKKREERRLEREAVLLGGDD